MTDTDPDPAEGDDQGDRPDTFDDRLTDIAILIDHLADETDEDRRLRHRAVVVRLLAVAFGDALARIAAQLERVDG